MKQYRHLTQEERYMIYQLKKKAYSIRKIAGLLNRSASTVSRELLRNTGKRGYRPQQAESFCLYRRYVEHQAIRITQEDWELVDSYLTMDWSPEQVSNYLKREHSLRISTESIYKHVWTDKALGGKLYTHLRQSRKKRRKRYGSGYTYRGHIKNRISIDERPAVIETKERIGDWEIDTVIGKGHKGALVSVVERKSRYTLVGKLKSRDVESLNDVTIELLSPFKDSVHSITADNGKEFAGHETLSNVLDTVVYFAHPYCSWERGLNENTNGLIRQYIPKGSSLDEVSEATLQLIMDRLNNRPRKCLGFKTPKKLFLSAITYSSPHGEKKGKKNKLTTKNCTVAVTN